jgi:hypothetical protein
MDSATITTMFVAALDKKDVRVVRFLLKYINPKILIEHRIKEFPIIDYMICQVDRNPYNKRLVKILYMIIIKIHPDDIFIHRVAFLSKATKTYNLSIFKALLGKIKQSSLTEGKSLKVILKDLFNFKYIMTHLNRVYSTNPNASILYDYLATIV